MKHVLIVSNSGGHLAQALLLVDGLGGYRRTWVSENRPDVVSRLAGERLLFGHSPTPRNARNFIRNLILAVRLLRREKPDLVLSTGAGLFLPFALAARLRGIPTVFVEVYDRVESLTLTGRLVRPLVSRFYVQWPELVERYPGSRYIGQLF